MKTLIITTALIAATATTAQSECVTAMPGEVSANPDGYYVRSLKAQISHGDTRIVEAVGDTYRICTRPAATPEMDATRAYLTEGAREITKITVPAFLLREIPAI